MLSACTIDQNKTVDRSKFLFKTYDDTELFFKNVRQSEYDLEALGAANINVFRINQRNSYKNQPHIGIAIVMNWLQDEAYILIEPNALLNDEEHLHLISKDSAGMLNDIRLEGRGKEAMLEFATQIYEGIQQQQQFDIVLDPQRYPFLKEKKDRDAFRKTMSDYYRLTRVF